MQNCATGVAITAPSATVQLQNVRFEDVDAPYDFMHPDVIQTWRGPKEIRIDRLTADFSSKGFLWMSVNGTFPQRVDQRRVNFRRWSKGGERPSGPHIFTWHPSSATRSTCADCWSEMGWFSRTSQRKLQDGWGTFDNPDGTNQFVPYVLGRGTQRLAIKTRAEHESLRGDLGGRQGDFMERLAPSLAGERWQCGRPARRRLRPRRQRRARIRLARISVGAAARRRRRPAPTARATTMSCVLSPGAPRHVPYRTVTSSSPDNACRSRTTSSSYATAASGSFESVTHLTVPGRQERRRRETVVDQPSSLGTHQVPGDERAPSRPEHASQLAQVPLHVLTQHVREDRGCEREVERVVVVREAELVRRNRPPALYLPL